MGARLNALLEFVPRTRSSAAAPSWACLRRCLPRRARWSFTFMASVASASRPCLTPLSGGRVVFDAPAAALHSACTIRDAMAAHAVRTRAGVHTGECEIIGEDVTGIAVHVAARIAGAAGAGEVFASATVRDLVAGSGIRLSDRGLHKLKGLPGKQPLVAVDAMAASKRLYGASGMTAHPCRARTGKRRTTKED